MNYNEAKDLLYNGDGRTDRERGEQIDALYDYITDNNIEEGLQQIKEITACDDDTANLLWIDVVRDFGTKENNPILQARERYEKEQALQEYRQRAEEYKYRNNAECPYCHSKNTKKISGFSKAGSVALFGVFAMGKVSKQWHCNQCKSDF